jgi:hypothetical protein
MRPSRILDQVVKDLKVLLWDVAWVDLCNLLTEQIISIYVDLQKLNTGMFMFSSLRASGE